MFNDYIKSETLAKELIFDELAENEIDLNGHKANIVTKKA